MTRDTAVAMKQSDLDKIMALAISLGFKEQLLALNVHAVELPYVVEGNLVGSGGRVVSPLKEYPHKDIYDALGIWDFDGDPR